MKPAKIISILVILASFAVGIYFYPQMPDRFVSHWNAYGQPDGYMTKFLGLSLMPIISVIMFLMFLLIPKIDPLKENIFLFRKYFDNFISLIMLFLFYLYLLTIFWNLGRKFNFIQLLVPAFAILFYYGGILISHAKRNWFIGIRTPWTLSSDNVWDKTHKLGGKLFKIAAVVSLIGLIFPEFALWFVLIPILFAAFYPIVYSYFAHKSHRI